MANTAQPSLAQGMRVKIVTAFLAIYLIWGTTFLGIRIAVETLPAFMMAGLRFFLAGGVMLLILLARGGRFPSLRQWRAAATVGGLLRDKLQKEGPSDCQLRAHASVTTRSARPASKINSRLERDERLIINVAPLT